MRTCSQFCIIAFVEETEKISKREFARRVGVSETAIRKAIKDGRIVKGYDPEGKRKSIIYEVALEEYSANHDPVRATIKKPKTRKPKPEALQDIQADAEVAVAVEDDGQLHIDFNKSRAEKMAYEAKIKKIEYNQKQGLLVERDAVYKALYSKGKEIRTALEAIPDRIVDDVLASQTRNEGHSLITKAINEVLTILADSSSALDKNL